MPLVRRVPKRGFNNRWGLKVAVVNIGRIDGAFDAGDEVTLESLAAKYLARGRFDLLKVLGDGDVEVKVFVAAEAFTASARSKIEDAGGYVQVLAPEPEPEPEPEAADTEAPADEASADAAAPAEAPAEAPVEDAAPAEDAPAPEAAASTAEAPAAEAPADEAPADEAETQTTDEQAAE